MHEKDRRDEHRRSPLAAINRITFLSFQISP